MQVGKRGTVSMHSLVRRIESKRIAANDKPRTDARTKYTLLLYHGKWTIEIDWYRPKQGSWAGVFYCLGSCLHLPAV